MVMRPTTEETVAEIVRRQIDAALRNAISSSDHSARLEQQIADYERRYNVPSAEVHQRIEDGLLEEDLNVCDWLIALDCLAYERRTIECL